MIREHYKAVCDGTEIREHLIALKEALKDEKNRRAFAYLLGGDFSVLTALLHHADPKVRKNAALLLGKMESEDLLPILFDAYKKEETRFAKADYLKAIAQMDCERIVPQLKERLAELRSREVLPEEQKHTAEEIRILQSILLQYQKTEHRFCGFDLDEDVILVTSREQREVTARGIPAGRKTLLKGGVRVQGVRLGTLLPIRTYTELLFPIRAEVLTASDPAAVGRGLAESSLTEQMARMHQGEAPYCFRIELKGKMELSRKGSYIRKISDALEQSSGGRWINSTDHYEAEVRLIERKDGAFSAFLKLYTIKDPRFAYRKEVVASSIAPVNAALTAELARPYLKPDAQILDPFCGVGTMLIERTRAVPAKTMYGLDIFGEAIEKARVNAVHAGCRINYINRDFFSFEHEYLFDEIITDLPQVTQAKPKQEIRSLYLRFFAKAEQHLKEDGILVLYVTEPQFVAEAVRRNPVYRIEECFTIHEKNHTAVYVIRRKHK